MSAHHEKRRVRHSPEDVFTLVADVRDYPNFIKWIKAMRVFDDQIVDGVGALSAEAVVGYKFVREKFATEVRLDRPNRAIDVAFLSGPFKALENRWRFHPEPDGATLVEFWITFQFQNPLLQALFDANFQRAVDKLIGAFETRAAERFTMVGEPAPTNV